jgi:hypothetical protein
MSKMRGRIAEETTSNSRLQRVITTNIISVLVVSIIISFYDEDNDKELTAYSLNWLIQEENELHVTPYVKEEYLSSATVLVVPRASVCNLCNVYIYMLLSSGSRIVPVQLEVFQSGYVLCTGTFSHTGHITNNNNKREYYKMIEKCEK